ncbi:MAG: hypothetical protein K2M97_05715, partial [Muribaculaceae bacterium]|nr:hypothetical protein [Muribaculaceae bacterium]
IETMFLNLLRGCGIHGVRAMLPVSGRIIRPLLSVARADLLDYLDERGLTYVVDSTNACSDFRRNRLRNEVIPALCRAFPDAPDALARSLANLRGCEALYSSMLPQAIPSLDVIRSSAAPSTLIHELLAPYGFNSSQTASMLNASSGASFRSASHVVDIDRGEISIRPLASDHESPRPPRLAHRRLSPAEFTPRAGSLYLDVSALDGDPEWELRPAATGDRMRPYGMKKGSRLLSDIFATARLSVADRRRQWVLTRNGLILWIVGLRASAHFPVTSDTTEIIEIYEED